MRRLTPRYLWRELTRSRSLSASRRPFQRAHNQRSGVALLVAITTMLVLTVLVSELSYVARVRFLIAYHQRDEAQAYWLARSGVNIYILILSADKEIGSQIESFAGDLGFASLWQMVPVINTGLMRMLFTGGGDVDDFSEEELTTFSQTGQVSDEVAQASRDEGSSLFSDKNVLDFEGDFSAEVTDNEGKIDVNQFDGFTGNIQDSATAQLLFARMNSEEDEAWFLDRGLDRYEIIGNLADWIDADNIRSSGLGGYEDNLYNVQEPPYLAKNAKLDTFEEIRLVEGWQDDVFNRYAKDLTIWSNGKFNPGSFSKEMHIAVITAYATTQWTQEQVDALCFQDGMEDWGLAWYQGGSWKSAKEYAQDVQANCNGIELDTSQMPKFTDKSRVFTVTSTGLVGTSQTTITAVLDYTRNNTGDVIYWRVE
jgi:type II secretory pathway component PulK